jgi:hypothetical protein
MHEQSEEKNTYRGMNDKESILQCSDKDESTVNAFTPAIMLEIIYKFFAKTIITVPQQQI